MANIAVLGAGGFGTSMAVSADQSGHRVTLWGASEVHIQEIRQDRENKRLLPGISVRESIQLTSDIRKIADAELVLFAIPTSGVREVAKTAAPWISKSAVAVNMGKGLEDGTFLRMSQVLAEELPGRAVAVLAGPSHAEEVGLGMPTTVVASSLDLAAAARVQDLLSSAALRIYLNDDIIGCELGGALKNIIALCAGICDGMGYGDNTKAALMTRGMTEISRLGVAMGAKMDTFAGLSGIGDLIVTCTSMHSRNRRAGILIGKGKNPLEAVAEIGTVEGYLCAKVAWELCQKMGVSMPITEQLHEVLWHGKEVRRALTELMDRPKKHEIETSFTSKERGEAAQG